MEEKVIYSNIQKQVAESKLSDELTKKKIITDTLNKYRDEIKKALPNSIPIDRVLRIMLTAISSDPLLLKCTPNSIIGCAIKSAQLGLFPDNLLGQCHFVPFYNNKKNNYQAQLIIGYRGYIDLMYRSAMVKSIYANCVTKEDKFEFEYGSNQFLKHIPSKKEKLPAYNDIIFAYAYVFTTNGGFIFEVIDKNDIEFARSFSKTKYELSAWNLHYLTMIKKTVLRRIIKYVPVSTELRIVDMLETMYETDEGQNWDNIIEVNSEPEINTVSNETPSISNTNSEQVNNKQEQNVINQKQNVNTSEQKTSNKEQTINAPEQINKKKSSEQVRKRKSKSIENNTASTDDAVEQLNELLFNNKME